VAGQTISPSWHCPPNTNKHARRLGGDESRAADYNGEAAITQGVEGILAGTNEVEMTMEGKEELLKLAHHRLEQAAKLLEAAGEEVLAEEAEALAERVDLAEVALHE
jgi:hypothetical protein